MAGQSYLETAISETKEELGLSIFPSELHEFGKKRPRTNEQENILTTVYALQRSLDTSKMRLEAEEVELVQWFDIQELEEIFKIKDPAWNKFGFELEMLAWLKTAFTFS